MDTTSHICMGAAIGITAKAIITNDISSTETSLITFSIIANVIPDIDIILKLKNNATYINNHRGVTHSIIFALLWILLLSGIGSLLIDTSFTNILIISTIGISLHIFTDLLNSYGVMFLWPFDKKWIAFGITYTFDFMIIASHLLAFGLLFFFKTDPLVTMIILFSIINIYFGIAYAYHYYLKMKLIEKYGNYKRLILKSRSTPHNWKYVYETTDKRFFIGTIRGRSITQLRYEKRKEILDKNIEKILYENKDIKSFLDFCPIYNYNIVREGGLKIIRFYDLRYLMIRNDRQMYQFNAVVKMKDNKIVNSYVGFVINEDILHKKISK